MRVAVVDIGTNSTRLLVADVTGDGGVTELERRSTVTRLGQGVDATGALAPEAMDRVFGALEEYRGLIDAHGTQATTAVLTSAVRDASNGPEFMRRVRDDHGLDARTIPGEEEARLTYLGATSERDLGDEGTVVVIDIGGGSTEFVVGDAGGVRYFASTQAGVVRQSERHIRHDPPRPDELADIADEARGVFTAAIPADVRRSVTGGIAVAGTATSLAAIAQDLEPYDPERVHGFRLSESLCELLLARLAQLDDSERREVAGLHPDRAPTIVPGIVLLREAMEAFGLDAVTVSEHDILRGAALERAGRG